MTDAAGLTDTATVTVGVTDVNEAPTAADASFTIAENAGTNAVVGSVTASDPDAGDTISYAITGGNADGAFAIDANGQITVANGSLLDHETAPSRTLTVTVTDAASPTPRPSPLASPTSTRPDRRGRELHHRRERRHQCGRRFRHRVRPGCRATRSPTLSPAATPMAPSPSMRTARSPWQTARCSTTRRRRAALSPSP